MFSSSKRDGFRGRQKQGRDAIKLADLRRATNPATLGFLSTAELEPLDGLLGQERGLEAVSLGLNLRADRFNIFAIGPHGSGKLKTIEGMLDEVVPGWAAPSDWVYVHNFRQAHRPVAIEMKPGEGPQFAQMMVDMVDELRVGLPALFDSEEYLSRRRIIDLSFESDQEDAIDNLVDLALTKDIQIVRTASGFTMLPLEDGEIVEPDDFAAKPLSERRIVEAKIKDLERQLSEIMERLPQQQKERAEQLQALNVDMAHKAVSASLATVRTRFGGFDLIGAYLDDVEGDLVRHVGLFTGGEIANVLENRYASSVDDPRFRRYMVNVLVTEPAGGRGKKTGAPVLKVMNPTISQLVGAVETLAELGTVNTDHTMIKAGALHQANGGVLLLDAEKLMQNPHAWEGVKRALLAKFVRVESPIDDGDVSRPISLQPEPIPLNVRVILFGERQLYHHLKETDHEFTQLFKIQAEFDAQVDRTRDVEIAYARLIAAVLRRRKLRAMDSVGVARLIEESARQAGDAEKLEINFVTLQDVLEEADYWAKDAGRKNITHEDVHKTLRQREGRASHVRDKLREEVLRDLHMVATDGTEIGQINALSVMEIGDSSFGRANRITARVRLGSGRVTDIEREAELGGSLHSKGVMILWGYLAGTYAQTMPLSLSASLVFEQSYHGVDGDSASAAELVALLSALANAPIRQGIAVTGSINQLGQMQTIGGVNEKIEGFFDICKARGLTGEQGVVVPYANRVNLMLREDVVTACGRGKFHIHMVKDIDEALEVLTGMSAGKRSRGGAFSKGSVNRAVEARLMEMAVMRRKFNDIDS